jgi:predicted transcriptional regulator
MQRKTASLTGFFLEDRLLSMLKKSIPPRIAPKKCNEALTFAKFQVGTIIPDLVIVAAPKNYHTRPRNTKITSFFESAVLAELLKHSPQSSEQIAKKLYARNTSLDRALARLIRLGLLSKNKSGTFIARKYFFPTSVKIVSVEAKLLRWKDAISQAKEYLLFSNTSYVALPQRVILANKKIRIACKKEGIGLIAVSSKGTQILLKGKNFKPISPERVWLIRKAGTTRGTRRIILKR